MINIRGMGLYQISPSCRKAPIHASSNAFWIHKPAEFLGELGDLILADWRPEFSKP